MLVLSRKKNQSIIITVPEGSVLTFIDGSPPLEFPTGFVSEITIVEMRGDKVRVGIQSDIRISIHRKEIQDKIDKKKAEEKKASETVESKD